MESDAEAEMRLIYSIAYKVGKLLIGLGFST